MHELLETLMGVSLVVFMCGNLLGVGIELELEKALGALRDLRFVVVSTLWAFVLCPGLAILLTELVPMPEPYALGLVFLGLSPCAPFLPMVSDKAGGDSAYVAAFLLLAAVGTVLLMPLAVPVLAEGFSASPWTIAQPLLLFVALPLAVGVVLRSVSVFFASRALPVVKKVTSTDSIVLVVLCFVIYWSDFIGAIGTHAIGAQVLFCTVAGVGSYGLRLGMPAAQRRVLALGVCTRNIGAALAPLMSVAGTDRRAIAMCALAVPITVVFAFIGAALLRRCAPRHEPALTRSAAEEVG